MKKIRQIISILSVVTLMVSATVGLNCKATEIASGNYKVDTETVTAEWLTEKSGKNILAGGYIREQRGNTSYDNNNANEKDRLNSIIDNDIRSFSNLNTSANPLYYYFNPKKTVYVKQVVLSFAKSSQIKDFEVYFSDDEKTLFSSDNTNKVPVAATSYGARNYLITLDSYVECKYIGVAVKVNSASKIDLHIAEIAAYQDSSVTDDFDQSFLAANASKNIATGMSIDEYRNGTPTGSFTTLTDNDLSTLRGPQRSIASRIEYDFKFNYGRPVKQLLLAYSSDSDVLNFKISLSNINAAIGTTDITASETYVQNIIEVNTISNKRNYLITLDKPVMASRVIFRLENPNGSSITYNIAELGVYADEPDYLPKAVEKTADYFAKSYFNLLRRATTSSDKNLTDRDFKTNGGNLAIGESRNYELTAEYELPEAYTINKFMVASIWSALPQVIEVYVSETKEDLYTSAPIVYTNNRTVYTLTGNDDAKALEITLNTPVTGKYIGFKFTDAESNSLYISEIAVYSTVPQTIGSYSINDDYGVDSLFKAVSATDGNYVIDAAEMNVNAIRVKSTSNKTYSIYLSSDATIENATKINELSGSRLIMSSQALVSKYIIVSGNSVDKVGYSSGFSVKPGDLSGNGFVQADDLALIRRELLGESNFDLMLKDANGDGSFDVVDFVNLKKSVASSPSLATKEDYISVFNSAAAESRVVLGAFDNMLMPNNESSYNNYSHIASVYGITPALYNTIYPYSDTNKSISTKEVNRRIIKHSNEGALCLVSMKNGWVNEFFVKEYGSCEAYDALKKKEFIVNFDSEYTGEKIDGVYAAYLKYREQLADAFEELKDAGVTVMYRPFVEMTNSLHRYCYTNTEQGYKSFKNVWKQLHDYLENERGLDNIVWCFAPQAAGGAEQGMKFYPGNDYVDVIGMTFYSNGNEQNGNNIIYEIPRWDFTDYFNLGKPVGFSEFGASPVFDADGNVVEKGDFSILINQFKKIKDKGENPLRGNISFAALWAEDCGLFGNNIGQKEFIYDDIFIDLQELKALQ